MNTRAHDALRPIQIVRHFTRHAPGSVLFSIGDTKVLCTASVSNQLPRFLQNSNQGWVTAEYGMLPSATHSRNAREAARGKQSGRTIEIQRLIGRSLRQVVDLKQLTGYCITVDCDVIQADGGTRCAAITGGCIALIDAIRSMQDQSLIQTDPVVQHIAAISVGMCSKTATLDLDYTLDSTAETDMNVIMTDQGEFIEIQGTAEHQPFSRKNLDALLTLAETGIKTLITEQKNALAADVLKQ